MFDEIGAYLMENAEVFGAVLLIIQAFVTAIVISQRARLKNAEATAEIAKSESERVKREADAKMEQVRGENAETMALFKLLEQQLANTANLADRISEQNKILTLQGRQHTDAMQMIAESNAASNQLSERIANQILGFQEFSREQHARTRGAIADAAQDTTDEIARNLEEVRTDLKQFREAMNGNFKRLEPQLQERFNALERRVMDAIAALKPAPPPVAIVPVVNPDIGEDEDGKPDTSLLDKAG